MRTALTSILLLVSWSAAAQTPHIPVQKAICLAQKYLADNRVKNDHRYLQSAAWHGNHEIPSKGCWSLMWQVDASPPIFDVQLVVSVCADGTIKHQDDWA